MQTANNYIAGLMKVRQSTKDLSIFLKERGFNPGTIIDVGVAFGTPDIYCLSDEATLVLVEPVIEFREYINEIKKKRQALVYYGAVSSEDGELKLWVTPDMTTSSFLVPMNATNDAKQRTVPCWKLDTLHRQDNWHEPYFLKIDVQGAELLVLDGATEVLKQTEIVLLEVSLFSFSPGLPDFFDVISYMKHRGFVVYDMFNGHNRPLDRARGQIDVAFVKENGIFRKDTRWGTSEQCKEFLEWKFARESYQKLHPSFIKESLRTEEVA